jgi:predicted NAD/FAD-binding protein
VIEKEQHPGGNAVTETVLVDGQERWVDLGVNDFNVGTFTGIKNLMDELGAKYSPINHSTCLFTKDSNSSYTIDRAGVHGVEEGLANEIERFKDLCANFLKTEKLNMMTAQEFVKQNEFSQKFATLFLYPRISSLFFSPSTAPWEMPVHKLIHFMKFQEGLLAPKDSLRCYFENGSRSWINLFVEKLKQMGCQFQFGKNSIIEFRNEEAKTRYNISGNEFDLLVLATDATAAIDLLKDDSFKTAKNILSEFTYEKVEGIIHSFTGVLCRDPSFWRTYNLRIFQPSDDHSYSITFYNNFHQNDSANPKYREKPSSPFFLTLNSHVEIPKKHIFKKMNGDLAIHHFKHCIMDKKSITTQIKLEQIQGDMNLYFSNAFAAQGIGLHEDSWQHGKSIAEMICNKMQK